MPRNEIATIVGVVVALLVLLAWPGPAKGLPRTRQGYPPAFVAFCVTFLVARVLLRLAGVFPAVASHTEADINVAKTSSRVTNGTGSATRRQDP